MHVYLIQNDDEFPSVTLANDDPNGLLATGGDLGKDRLLSAYSQGIFPWYSEGEPILWWSPHPRSVLFPEAIKISRSLKKTLKKQVLSVTTDRAFSDVIRACAEPRKGDANTWINYDMIKAYEHLHAHGYAHSIEAWEGESLVGGLYGIALGHIFFGESMFSRVSDASKVAFVCLVKQLKIWGYKMIDCQIKSEHLDSFGAIDIPREKFVQLLDEYRGSSKRGFWHTDIAYSFNTLMED